MTILLVAATLPEVRPLLDALGPHTTGPHTTTAAARLQHLATPSGTRVDLLVTGVGVVATATWCARALAARPYDVALNVGVCGSFAPAFPPGTVVHVVSEQLPELGAEDGDTFLPLQQLGLLGEDEDPWRGGRLRCATPPANAVLAALPQAHGITVNCAHGDEASIARLLARLSPDVESMEGAAFMYACLTAGAPFAQVRAVSNVVERRNRAAWQLGPAIANLTAVTRRLLDSAWT